MWHIVQDISLALSFTANCYCCDYGYLYVWQNIFRGGGYAGSAPSKSIRACLLFCVCVLASRTPMVAVAVNEAWASETECD